MKHMVDITPAEKASESGAADTWFVSQSRLIRRAVGVGSCRIDRGAGRLQLSNLSKKYNLTNFSLVHIVSWGKLFQVRPSMIGHG
jgi:hypothetical protein